MMIKSAGDRRQIPGATRIMFASLVWCQILTAFLWVVKQGGATRGTPDSDSTLPSFAEPVVNLTVPVGRDARLSCVINNLGSYRVAWLRVESKTILTIHNHIITRNYRISLSNSNYRQWDLHINNVQESDRGGYMCQINTEPMNSQVGYLDVVVPPDIVGGDTSADVMVREGSNVTLSCRAKGYPLPRITWRREDGQAVTTGSWNSNKNPGTDQSSTTDAEGLSSKTTFEGEQLTITKVSRLHMGAYLCIASNGVPPSVSRRVLLQVHFPPMIWIPNQLVGASVGGSVSMECHTEAYPVSINYWTKEDGDMIISNDKYAAETDEKSYKIDMRLRIKYVQAKDFGTYTCYAKNSLGSTEGTIRLYEIHLPSQPAKEPSTAKIHSFDGVKQAVADESEDTASAQLHPPSIQPEDRGLTDLPGKGSVHPATLSAVLAALLTWLISRKWLGT